MLDSIMTKLHGHAVILGTLEVVISHQRFLLAAAVGEPVITRNGYTSIYI